ESFSSARPCRRSDRRRTRRRARGRGSRGGGCGSGTATVERGRLLDRMPFPVLWADRGRQYVLVGPALAAAVVLRPALPHGDLGDEDQVVEVLEARRVRLARALASVPRLDAVRALQDLLEAAAVALHHLLLTGGRARQQEVVENLAVRVRT